jgi:hypothetical protein
MAPPSAAKYPNLLYMAFSSGREACIGEKLCNHICNKKISWQDIGRANLAKKNTRLFDYLINLYILDVEIR